MFQDAFTYEINRQVSYPVKTINWGYWSQQQTDTDGIHKQYEAYLERKGIYSLNAEEGMESLERILNYKSEQVIVAKVSDEVLENLGLSMVKNSLVDSLPDRSSMLNRLLAETNQF
jgi:polyketide synthase PksM